MTTPTIDVPTFCEPLTRWLAGQDKPARVADLPAEFHNAGLLAAGERHGPWGFAVRHGATNWRRASADDAAAELAFLAGCAAAEPVGAALPHFASYVAARLVRYPSVSVFASDVWNDWRTWAQCNGVPSALWSDAAAFNAEVRALPGVRADVARHPYAGDSPLFTGIALCPQRETPADVLARLVVYIDATPAARTWATERRLAESMTTADPSKAAPESPTTGSKPHPAALALSILLTTPDISPTELAEQVGVSRGTLYGARPPWKAVRDTLLARDKGDRPRGRKDANGGIDAFSDPTTDE